MKAFILAAGRGERLGKLTATIPKPLLVVQGAPLIVHHLRRLKAQGFFEIMINVSYLAEKIQAALGDGRDFGLSIQYSYEPVRLETAGGIRQVLSWFEDEKFLLINADIFTEFPFESLRTVAADAHLVLVPNPLSHPNGDYALANGKVSAAGLPRYTYSGIAVYHPSIFERYAPGYRKLTEVFEGLIQQQALYGALYIGQWVDVGSPEVYEAMTHG